jgi:hypothetical protein
MTKENRVSEVRRAAKRHLSFIIFRRRAFAPSRHDIVTELSLRKRASQSLVLHA